LAIEVVVGFLIALLTSLERVWSEATWELEDSGAVARAGFDIQPSWRAGARWGVVPTGAGLASRRVGGHGEADATGRRRRRQNELIMAT